jgi:hypothetical protein
MVLHAHTQRVYENGDQNSSLEDPALDECLQALARKATHFVKSALGKSLVTTTADDSDQPIGRFGLVR